MKGLTLVALVVLYFATQAVLLAVIDYPTRLPVLMSMAIAMAVFIILIDDRRVN